MRTIQVEGAESFTIEAPSVVAYVFNRMPFVVRHDSAVQLRATFIVNSQGMEIGSEEREAFGGTVSAMLQQYFQSAFRTLSMTKTATDAGRVLVPSQMMKAMSVVISASATLEDGEIETMTYTVTQDVIFGMIGARETSAMPSKIRLYPNLPQTFDLLANQNTKLYLEDLPGGSVVFDRELAVSVNGMASGYRMINVNISRIGAGYSLVNIVVRPAMVINGAEVVAPTTWRTVAEVDLSTCGTYLRWIDRHGRWQYFLFRETESSYDTKTVEEWESAATNDPTDYVDGLNNAVNVWRVFSTSNTRKLTARLVDEGLRELLRSLMMAVVVDVYDGKNSAGDHLWHRVQIKPGKISTNYAPLQDFSVEIEEPEVNSQIP